MAAARARCSRSRRSSAWPGVFVERFDVDGIRLTGGEPTVRAHLPVLVAKLAALRVGADAGAQARPVDDHQRRHVPPASPTTCAPPGSTG